MSDDWEKSKNVIRYSSDSNDSFVRLPLPPNDPEHLRGGIHTLKELSSPNNGHNNNNQNDNNNGIILVNPSVNPPLRLTLRLDNNPPSIEHCTSNEAEIVRLSNERGLRLSPLRNNEQIIDVGKASVGPEMMGSQSNRDPLGLQVPSNSMRLSPRVSPDLDQDILSDARKILPRHISSQVN